MASILIVDDDAALREALSEALQDLGHAVVQAADGHRAVGALARGGIDAVLLDLRMPGEGGLDVLTKIRARLRPPPVTILTAHATADNTIEAMRRGAFDHLTKPVRQADLARVIDAMLASRPPPAAASGSQDSVPDAFIGQSDAMRAVHKSIGRLADSATTVLVTGETGTGKEVVARALHDYGTRKGAPFIAVNCAAIPRDLLESELFGHRRGAFTGATADRPGAFRAAHGGTLFLDEIGDMDLAMQAKILRVLQERIVVPVGGTQACAVDVRIIAATHRDLAAAARCGAFREDLYYRLAVVPLHLPPLRERLADILPLAEHFLRQAGGQDLDAGAASLLVRQPWPGNVRQLRNAMQRVAMLGRAGRVRAQDLDFLEAEAGAASSLQGLDWPDEDLPTAIARLEDMLIRRALRKAAGNRTQAARRLNIRRQLLYAKLERYGLAASAEGTEDVRLEDDLEPGSK